MAKYAQPLAHLSPTEEGSLQDIYWRNQRHQWRYLQNIPFPSTADKPYVDVLLGGLLRPAMLPTRNKRSSWGADCEEDTIKMDLCGLSSVAAQQQQHEWKFAFYAALTNG